ncbi:MAG TPA: DNA polymerase, partial [Terriglobia bacterium]|nr:DNA polymerase [Terriglobia bacterium]
MLVDVPRKKYASLSYFLRHIEEHYCSREFDTIIFGYHLVYEFTQLFRDLRDKDLPAFNVYLVSPLTGKSWWINVWNDKRYMATFYRLTRPPTQKELDTNGRYHPRSTVRITLLDASAFYHGGLDAVGEMLGLGAKEHKPQEFSRKFRNLPSFVKYAKQDAYLTRLIGEKIVADHERYDIRQCISAPMYAAKVFRRKFLNDEIPLAKPDIEQAGLYSYHGGKNGYYRNGPKHLPNVYAYDITSAYPEAMRALPNPVVSEFVHTSVYVPRVHALYCISGTYRRCKYRAFLSHAQGWQVDGVIDSLWITSYELDAALEHDEIALTNCHGYIMDGPPGGPLADYVDEFFDLKSKSVGAMRELAKLLLNSLYGKFFQKVPLGSMKDEIEIVQTGDKPIRFDQHETWAFERRQTDPDQEYDYQAGGLYHPAIASLITGFVRAKIHRLEHKYDAIMTSTDGFFATRKPDPSDIGTNLGKLTVGFGD